jgi:hypothetical protein
MAQFIIRIQLTGVAPDNGLYTTLHDNLSAKDIYQAMYHIGNKKWYALPDATYYTHAAKYAGSDRAVEAVARDVKEAIATSINEYREDGRALNVTNNVLVVEAREGGLPFYTDFPEVQTPWHK